MIAELIIPLVDKCIELLQLGEEHKQRFLDEMITPVYEQFDLLHKGYLESFKLYRTQIVDAGSFAGVASTILQNLRDDNLFTGDQRAKAFELTKAIRLKKTGNSRLAEGIQGFVDSIYHYLGAKGLLVNRDESPELLFPYGFTSQRWRNSFAEELRELIDVGRISDETKRKVALFHLDATVSEMQELYYHTTAYYMLVKKELLKAIYQ